MISKNKCNNEIRLLSGNILSKMFFLHLGKIAQAGVKKAYQFDMLFKMDKVFTYQGDYPPFQKYFDKNKKSYENNFLGLILGYIRPYFLICLFFTSFNYICQMLIPYALRIIVQWVEDNGSLESGIIYVGITIVIIILQVQGNLWGYYYAELQTLRVKNPMRVRLISYLFLT